MTTAYDKVMALKLAEQQAKQREMTAEKIGQKLMREWLGALGTRRVDLHSVHRARRLDQRVVRLRHPASSPPAHNVRRRETRRSRNAPLALTLAARERRRRPPQHGSDSWAGP